MLGVGVLPPPSAPPPYLKPTTICNPICLPLQFQCKTHNKHLFHCPQLHHSLSSSLLLSQERTGFCLFAQKKQKDSSFSGIELETQALGSGFDDEEDDYDEFDEGFVDGDEFDDVDDDEDDDIVMPFDKMNAWYRQKPRGFGEGKEYDTSLEDKLLEELEKSRQAQLANIEKLKKEAKEPQKELNKVAKVEVIPGTVRVRINNLPKKMNIHRDLKSAFSGVNGIMDIIPAVSGTKKTRDPVCKGFAFVDFKSANDANRFVDTFSGQNIAFGKTGKRIKCEILKARDTSSEDPLNDGYGSSSVSHEEGVQPDNIDVLLSEPWEEDDDDEFDEDFDDTDIIGNPKSINVVEQTSNDVAESTMPRSLDSLSTKPKEEKKAVRKKPLGKKKPSNNSEPKVPGSAKRLKIQDKAKLADVFSRYGVKQAVGSKET